MLTESNSMPWPGPGITAPARGMSAMSRAGKIRILPYAPGGRQEKKSSSCRSVALARKKSPCPRAGSKRRSAAIKRKTSRPVRVRKHPGNHPPEIPIEDDLDNVWAVVTWGSSAAIKALAGGVPVFYCFPPWIGGDAAHFGLDDLESPYRGSREQAFHRIGWGQWRIEEISEGLPFQYLIRAQSAAA